MQKLLTLILVLLTCSHIDARQNEWQMGGRLAITIPTSIGKNYEKGFGDMATLGAQAAFTGRWHYNKSLSLGWDVAYQAQGGNNDFWKIDGYGDINVSYGTTQVLAEGNYYFNSHNFRPYLGIAFGGFWLNNTTTFNSNDEIANKSGTYKYNKLLPGLAPQLGFTYKLGRYTILDMHTRFIVMPNLEEEFANDGRIALNPHGAQNHLSISIGLLFDL